MNKLTESPFAIEMAQRLAEKQKVDSPGTVMKKVQRFDRITVGALLVAILSTAFVIAGLAPDANTRMLSVIISFGSLGVFISAMMGKNILLREAYVGEYIAGLALKGQIIEIGVGEEDEERQKSPVYVGLVPSADAALHEIEEELDRSEKFAPSEKKKLYEGCREVLAAVKKKKEEVSQRNQRVDEITKIEEAEGGSAAVEQKIAELEAAVDAPLEVKLDLPIIQVDGERIIGSVSGEPVVFICTRPGTDQEGNLVIQTEELDDPVFVSKSPHPKVMEN